MKKEFLALDIENPCNQPWSKMTSVSSGAHCDRCDSVVVDFTNRSDEYIRSVFLNSKERVCGRMYHHQLNRPLIAQQSSDSSFSLRAVALGLTLLSFPFIGAASESWDDSNLSLIELVQNEVINVNAPNDSLKRFLVVDVDTGEPIYSAKISLINHNKEVIFQGRTDFDGYMNVEEFKLGEEVQEVRVSHLYEGYVTITLKMEGIDLFKEECLVKLELSDQIKQVEKPIVIGQLVPVPKSIQRKQKRARKKEQRRQDSAADKNIEG